MATDLLYKVIRDNPTSWQIWDLDMELLRFAKERLIRTYNGNPTVVLARDTRQVRKFCELVDRLEIGEFDSVKQESNTTGLVFRLLSHILETSYIARLRTKHIVCYTGISLGNIPMVKSLLNFIYPIILRNPTAKQLWDLNDEILMFARHRIQLFVNYRWHGTSHPKLTLAQYDRALRKFVEIVDSLEGLSYSNILENKYRVAYRLLSYLGPSLWL